MENHQLVNFGVLLLVTFISASLCENAAAAKLLQSCLTEPRDGSPPGSSIYGIFQARVLEWGAIAFSIFTTSTTLLT